MNNILLFCRENGIEYKIADAKTFSTFRIGGEATVLLPSDTTQASLLIKELNRTGERFGFFGNCSNVLFPDDALPFYIIKTERMNTLSTEDDSLICGTGVLLSRVCNAALQGSLSGMESLFGIPGSVGGAVYMNAGAYGAQISDIVFETEYVDADGVIRSLPREKHAFGYRDSFFKQNGGLITKSVFKLNKGVTDDISRAMSEVSAKRTSSQPLEFPSAGSVFKRPDGYFAGKLIQDCGLKGTIRGGAQISEKHAGFIINTGGATAEDVKELISFIQKMVFDKFGVMLETEIEIF